MSEETMSFQMRHMNVFSPEQIEKSPEDAFDPFPLCGIDKLDAKLAHSGISVPSQPRTTTLEAPILRPL